MIYQVIFDDLNLFRFFAARIQASVTNSHGPPHGFSEQPVNPRTNPISMSTGTNLDCLNDPVKHHGIGN